VQRATTERSSFEESDGLNSRVVSSLGQQVLDCIGAHIGNGGRMFGPGLVKVLHALAKGGCSADVTIAVDGALDQLNLDAESLADVVWSAGVLGVHEPRILDKLKGVVFPLLGQMKPSVFVPTLSGLVRMDLLRGSLGEACASRALELLPNLGCDHFGYVCAALVHGDDSIELALGEVAKWIASNDVLAVRAASGSIISLTEQECLTVLVQAFPNCETNVRVLGFELDSVIRFSGGFLNVEIDGPTHQEETRMRIDRRRDALLRAAGIEVARVNISGWPMEERAARMSEATQKLAETLQSLENGR